MLRDVVFGDTDNRREKVLKVSWKEQRGDKRNIGKMAETTPQC